MKNQKIIESWNKIEPEASAKERMLNSILAHNPSGSGQTSKSPALKWILPIAVTAVLGFVIMIPLLKSEKTDFVLKRSQGVTVQYIEDPPAMNHDKTSLVWLEEDELLASHFADLEIVIFEGTVSEVRNIVCDFGWTKAYMAISSISVQDSLRGDLAPGSTVTVLLPGPVGSEMRQEDTGISYRLRAGVSGIFMPVRYDENTFYSAGENNLALMDLAEFGLPDGMRWMFLQTEQGLAYSSFAYPSFAGAQSLDDVKAVIRADFNLNESIIKYRILSFDWPVYMSARELTEAGGLVLLGEIKGISFQMLDMRKAEAAVSGSGEDSSDLNTIYEIEVIQVYKGDAAETICIQVPGGLENDRVDEQLAVLGDRGEKGIPLLEGVPDMNMGQTYLFVLHQYENTMPSLVNMDQAVYPVDEPFNKEGHLNISLQDIISSFGEDAWSDFEAGEFLAR